jgi:hypothetical protein
MKNLFRNSLYLFIALISLNACQNVKDGLSGKKKTNSDEFLVQKKNPLVLPPDYNKLPEPETLGIKNNADEEDLEINLGKSLGAIKKTTKIKTTNGSLEKSIIEKIKNN